MSTQLERAENVCNERVVVTHALLVFNARGRGGGSGVRYESVSNRRRCFDWYCRDLISLRSYFIFLSFLSPYHVFIESVMDETDSNVCWPLTIWSLLEWTRFPLYFGYSSWFPWESSLIWGMSLLLLLLISSIPFIDLSDSLRRWVEKGG